MRRRFDLIIRGAEIADGGGGALFPADIGVADGRIETLEASDQAVADEVVNGEGLCLAPGFIDVHTHDDRAVLATGMEAKLSQGVTTVIAGNCGISLAPLPGFDHAPRPLDLIARDGGDLFARFRDYLDAVEERGPAVNIAALTGHSTLRLAAMDRLDRAATGAECRRMRDMLDQALEDGSIGLSTGLYYDTAKGAGTAEVIAVAEPLGRHGAIYATHLRDEGDLVIEALEEAFEIGRGADAPVVLSHHKVTDARNKGRTRETLPLIAKRAKDQPVTLDVYPYNASSTVLQEARVEAVERIIVTWSKAMPEMAGRDLADIAAELNCTRREAAARLQPAGAIYFSMAEEDVRRVLAFDGAMIGSDGLPHDIRPHPRLWGTFPRVLGHYVRDVKLFGLAEAVRRMTSLPAARFGLTGRGMIRKGAAADLVLFDPQTITDLASFEEPARPAGGVKAVWVNGRLSWSEAGARGARAGRVIRNGDIGGRVFG